MVIHLYYTLEHQLMIQLQQQYFFCGCDNGFQALFYNVSAAKFEEETTKNINLLLGGFPVWEMIMQTEFWKKWF